MTKVEKKLLNAGWFPGRKIDTKEMEEHLIKHGYELFPTVKQFLEEFGMLYIAVENRCNDGERYMFHHTDVKRAVSSSRTYGVFKGIEKFVSERLLPVGEAHSGYLIMFVSETGKVYVDNVKLGNTFMEAWEKLMTPK